MKVDDVPRSLRGVLFDVGGTLLREGSGEPYEAVRETLEQLRLSYTLGVITNTLTKTENDIRQQFRQLGLESLFSCFVVSLDVWSWKPEPRIFQIALERSNLEAHEAVMVGNRVDVDIIGAKRVGMATILIDYDGTVNVETLTEEMKPDAKVSSLSEVPGTLQNLHA